MLDINPILHMLLTDASLELLLTILFISHISHLLIGLVSTTLCTYTFVNRLHFPSGHTHKEQVESIEQMFAECYEKCMELNLD